MTKWHETWAAQIGLRLGGGGVLSLAWVTGAALYARLHAHPPRDASFVELGLCALMLLLALVGNALLVVGPGLWKQVELPARRRATLTETYEFDPLTGQATLFLRDAGLTKEASAAVK